MRPGHRFVVLVPDRPRDLGTGAEFEHLLFPVGRLDMDVEGALLMTNDGELAHRVTHPRFQIDKVYLAWVNGIMATSTALKLETGVALEDGLARATRAAVLYRGKQTTLVQLVMREGRKREVKRLCKAVGHPVR